MSQSHASIIVIDDERPVCISCKRILEEEGYVVDTFTSGKEGVKHAVEGSYDIVLLDLKMPDLSGMEALDILRRERPELIIIIITGYATIQTSIEAIKKGAFDYVPKPFTPEELAIAVKKAVDDRALRRENSYLKEQLSQLRGNTKLLGRSRAFEDVMHQVLKIAPTDFTVMLYGESGTGKELIAQAIHENSQRRDKPFVAVDISSLTPSLIESELFGHTRGAFTGAVSNKPGYFSLAHQSTLFIDEISNISWELQGKLLRVLESRKVWPVGGNAGHDVDVRVVAATNRDLHEMVEQNLFREDLYYRLNVIPLSIPPLRERADDIPLLAMHYLAQAAKEASKPTTGFTSEAMAKMVSYDWPGNVRQLKNICERVVATCDTELIGVDVLPRELTGGPFQLELGMEDVPQNAEELKEVKRQLKEMVYTQVEKNFVIEALNRAGWNVTKAAEQVGMQRPNFHAIMRKYGIKTREDD